jgi:general stress protein 26
VACGRVPFFICEKGTAE